MALSLGFWLQKLVGNYCSRLLCPFGSFLDASYYVLHHVYKENMAIHSCIVLISKMPSTITTLLAQNSDKGTTIIH